jgi:geranylgeranyl diphosphate synthase, type II
MAMMLLMTQTRLEASSMPSFEQWLQQQQQRTQQQLQALLDNTAAPARLIAAMQYAVLGGGKRLRPLLAYAAAQAVGGDSRSADIPACAVEFIHAYSLIHDDLPSMDDDILRRGQPTCHIKFDEATAILAGDALQALAFELLASTPAFSDALRVQMLRELATASGWQGMVGGQALDIAATGLPLAESGLSYMHSLKTGALITASVVLGALSTGRASVHQLDSLRLFAQQAGLAFQIQDDILDVEASTAVSGKEQGKDARQHKATYPSVLGLAEAKQRLNAVAARADAALNAFGPQADRLRQLAQYLVQRPS